MKNEEEMSRRSSEFWGICCEGGKKYSQVVRKRFHITMAALDPTVVPTSPVVSLMVDRGGCEYLLCSLKPGSLLQVNLNLYFDKGEKVTFSLKGSGKIHLSGYILHEKEPIQNEAIGKDNSVSPTKNITKMSSPLKKNNLKFNEKSKMDINKSTQDVEKKSKDETSMKNNKSKQKIKVSDDDSDIEDPFDELEESSSDDEETDEENKNLKQDSNKLKNYKRLFSSLTQSDDEESESSEEEESDEEVQIKKISKKGVKEFQDKKKQKTDTSTPVLTKKQKQNTPEKSNKFDDKSASFKKKANDDMNSSIGRTPMPKKNPNVNQVNLSPKKVNFADIAESSDSEDELESPPNILSPTKKDDSCSNVETKKKKKKKKKQSKDSLNISNSTDVNVGKKNEAGLVSASYSQKLPGGLEFEDIKVGNGPVAKKGKLVHVYYTGMLANNKVFDSRKPGTKPFSFKLGAEQVIKGWDLGIEGMKVGGKRRLKIPPNLGYKNERMGPIPPMSKLYFTVELKAVS